jgi:hypothetical protein
MNESENYPYFMVCTATGLALTFADKDIVQISIYKFVLIYDWQTHQKNFKFQKKGFPFEPRYAGMCTFSTKKLRH